MSIVSFVIHTFIRKVARAFRTVKGRDSVEPNLSSALTKRNNALSELYDVRILEVPEKGGKHDPPLTEEKVGVFCSDLKELVSHLIEHRELDPSNCDVHIGIDGGISMHIGHKIK